MKDALTIEMVDNGYIMRGEDFAQVIDVTEGRDENMNLQTWKLSSRPHTPKHGRFWFMQSKNRNQHNKRRSLTKS